MEIKNMRTIEVLKEAQRLQIECVVHKLPIYITITAMSDQMVVFVQDNEHEVLFNEIFSDDPLLYGRNDRYYKELLQIISRCTDVSLAG